MSTLRVIANILWVVLVGWELAITWWVVGAVLCITIVGIPFGVQLFKLGLYAAWPFGRTTVDEGSGVSAVGNVLWVVLVGWWLALAHLVASLALAITLVGIPAAWVALKLVPVAFTPFGRRVVDAPTGDAVPR